MEKFKQEVIGEEIRGTLKKELREVVREEMGVMFEKKGKEEIEQDARKREEDSERGLIESAIRGYQRTMMTTNWGSPTARTRW